MVGLGQLLRNSFGRETAARSAGSFVLSGEDSRSHIQPTEHADRWWRAGLVDGAGPGPGTFGTDGLLRVTGVYLLAAGGGESVRFLQLCDL
jgi:hypothetical protein